MPTYQLFFRYGHQFKGHSILVEKNDKYQLILTFNRFNQKALLIFHSLQNHKALQQMENSLILYFNTIIYSKALYLYELSLILHEDNIIL